MTGVSPLRERNPTVAKSGTFVATHSDKPAASNSDRLVRPAQRSPLNVSTGTPCQAPPWWSCRRCTEKYRERCRPRRSPQEVEMLRPAQQHQAVRRHAISAKRAISATRLDGPQRWLRSSRRARVPPAGCATTPPRRVGDLIGRCEGAEGNQPFRKTAAAPRPAPDSDLEGQIAARHAHDPLAVVPLLVRRDDLASPTTGRSGARSWHRC